MTIRILVGDVLDRLALPVFAGQGRLQGDVEVVSFLERTFFIHHDHEQGVRIDQIQRALHVEQPICDEFGKRRRDVPEWNL